ncbi:P-loop containing nucleoside triphosphate hydrolase protein [Mycena kentingensis (nom. inval.)]|nr:P-loop containing nucleoside triphosphate hydrolase protein [Mycena kentingensis (nom. inval.)]
MTTSFSTPPSNTRRLQLGVWTVLIPVEPVRSRFLSLPSIDTIVAVAHSLPILWRFVLDVYSLNPLGTSLFFALCLLGGLEYVLILHATSQLLRVVEDGLRSGGVDASAVAEALGLRVFLIVLFGTTRWAKECLTPRLQSRVKLFFEDKLLHIDLSLDLSTSAESTTRSAASADEAWAAFVVLCEGAQRVFVLLTQLLFVSQAQEHGPGSGGGYLFSLLIFVHPLAKILAKPAELYWTPNLIYSDNRAFARAKALKMMVHDYYRMDVILGGLAGWIGAQYRLARDALGSTPTEHAESQYSPDSTPLSQIYVEIIGQLPTLYWALKAIHHPTRISMASIALLTQYSSQVRYTVEMVFWEFGRTTKCLSDIRLLYDGEGIENRVADGDRAYPRPEWEWNCEKGMDVRFENVSFSYPGTKTTADAIENISFHIPAGALTVIVGTNGSGKSTLIKLLARLYDVGEDGNEVADADGDAASDTANAGSPTSPNGGGGGGGGIFIDGLPIREYRLADLRRAQAHLTQDHQLFPLSIRENVSLGAAGLEISGSAKEEKVREALAAGGATGLVARFATGEETVLEPVRTVYERMLDDERYRELREFGAGIEKSANVSGGERQRLIASRTFMRLPLPGIKLLCVDEPSSALDPRGEFELFQRLRNSGAGITKLLVTHRFGHLTRHADVIICMKDGRIEEMGTHEELIGKEGEYAELYNLQAKAFMEA